MEREFHLSTGLISLLCASLSLAMSTVIQKELLQRYTPLQVIGTGIICGCIASIPLGWSLMDNYLQLPVETHLLIAYLAIFPSALAYLAWGYLLKHCETYQVASLLYIVPCGTAVFAYVWIGEILTGFTLLGGVISILGVALTQISRTQSRLFQRCLASSLRRNVITYR
jgi:drug/metabolite transporter (DMT)-like permease